MIFRFFPIFSVLALSLGLAGPGAAQEDDALLADNPALAALHARDPEAAAEVLDQIETLRDLPYQRQILVPSQDDDGAYQILIANPALADIHRRDPKATSKLLEIIRPQR